MRKILIVILLLSVSAKITFASSSDLLNYWQQEVNYNMSVVLDSAKNQMTGNSVIQYINNSPDNLDNIYLNLYHRAFQSSSVKAREYLNSKNSWRGKTIKQKDNTDWVHKYDVTFFKAVMPSGLSTENFEYDDTILKGNLPELLLPGDTLTIHVNWTHFVGNMFERSGKVKKQYNMAHWYPRTVVYDQKGWNLDPFHAVGEFYGDFGDFTVNLDLPGNYIAGATGIVTEGDPGWNSVTVDTSLPFNEWLEKHNEDAKSKLFSERQNVTFEAENVHDFAWVASPDFLYEHGSWNGIDVHVLFNKRNGHKWTKKVVTRSEKAVEWLSTNFGKYPYPQVTTTDRNMGGGMEYPMLVMNGSESESLIFHEIGHIWYYGILANNEVEEAWLDEGFTSFQEDWYMLDNHPTGYATKPPQNFVERYRKTRTLMDFSQWSAIKYQVSGNDEPIKRKSYLYNDQNYRYNVYGKPSLMLAELRYLLGDSLFLSGMQEYYRRWNLKHVNEERFTSAMKDVSGQDLEWFFESWLHDTQLLDYSLKSWKKKKNENGNWDLILNILKPGERDFPIEIGVEFSDGSLEKYRYQDFLWQFDREYTIEVPKEPIFVSLDPDVRTMDIDFRNNFTFSMPYEFSYDWPKMTYNPRNKFLLKWKPSLAYHEQDGLIPGLTLIRSYDLWEKNWANISFGTESGKIYGGFGGWRKPVHSLMGTTWSYSGYSYSGVYGGDISVSFKFDKNPSPDYTPVVKVGAYFTNTVDTVLTNLYDEGKVAVFYKNTTFSTKYGNSDLDIAVSPAGLSDWSFARVTFIQNFSMTKNKIGFRSRAILGKMWYEKTDGLPGQETYTIEGGGSGTVYQLPYLRDESSFFGLVEGRNAYHLSGDGNLRGFTGDGFSGAHQIATINLEAYYTPKIKFIDLELAAFTDGGLVWNDTFEGDLLFDAGFGLRFSKEIFSQKFYIRTDFPWLKMSPDEDFKFDTKSIIFSFQKSL